LRLGKQGIIQAFGQEILRRASTAANGVYATAPDMPGAVQGLASSLCLHLPLARCVGSELACIVIYKRQCAVNSRQKVYGRCVTGEASLGSLDQLFVCAVASSPTVAQWPGDESQV